MRKFRKDQNLQELNDALHNINLKEQLNSDLNKDAAILNPIANKIAREALAKDRYKEHVRHYKTEKLHKTAKEKAAIELLEKVANNKLLKEGSKNARLAHAIETERTALHFKNPVTGPMYMSKISPDDEKLIGNNSSATAADLNRIIKTYGLNITTAGKNIKTIKKDIRKIIHG